MEKIMAEIKPMNPMNPAVSTATPKVVTPSAQLSGMVTALKPAAVAAPKSAAPEAKKPTKKKVAMVASPKKLSGKKPKKAVKAKTASKPSPKNTAKEAVMKATSQARKGTDYTRATTKKAMEAGVDKMKKVFDESARETQKVQDQFMQFSRETADQIAQVTDTATRSINEIAEQSRSSMEALLQSGTVTSDMTRSFTNEMFRFANESFSDNIEISKEIFGCKTINDVYDMQNKMIRNNLDHFFNQTNRVSDMMFQFMSDAAEPFNLKPGAKKYKF
jgi:hypothetical protein